MRRETAVGLVMAACLLGLTGCGDAGAPADQASAELAEGPAAAAAAAAATEAVPTTAAATAAAPSQPAPPTTVPAPGTTARPAAATTTAVGNQPARFRLPYTDWAWPSPQQGLSYTTQDMDLTILDAPGTEVGYFFAHQFGFTGGVGGYVGLQTRGHVSTAPGAPLGKIALFSIFAGCDDRAGTAGCVKPLPIIGSSAQPGLLNGSSCAPMTSPSGAPEGPGASCRIGYEWRENVTYRLRVTLVEADVWQASVIDTSTGASTVIGRIRVPTAWGGLGTHSVTWTEFYSDTSKYTACSDLPRAEARWRRAPGLQSTPGLLGPAPAAAEVLPQVTVNHLANGTGPFCPNTVITPLTPKATGSIQRMGG